MHATPSVLTIAALSVLLLPRPALAQSGDGEHGGAIALGARARIHLRATFDLDAVASPLLTAALAQVQDAPDEWASSAAGYVQRYAAHFGQNAARHAIELAAGALLGHEPGYRALGRGPFWRRTWHALSSVAMARNRQGRRAPAWARVASAYGAASVSDIWYPAESGHGRHVLSSGTMALGGDALSNLWDEFWPDIRNPRR